MKKILFFCIVVMIIATISGCKKDLQPRYKKVIILKKTGQKIVDMEEMIKKSRASLNPLPYDLLADSASKEVYKVIYEELRDPTNIDKGDIPVLVKTFNELYWEKEYKNSTKCWKKMHVGVSDDVYRVCTEYAKILLYKLREYCRDVINGNINNVPGTRNYEIEDKIISLFYFSDEVEWQYKDRLHDYFRRYAQAPNQKAKPKKNGFLNFGWGD